MVQVTREWVTFRSTARWLVITAAVPLAGCSFAFVKGPPDRPHRYGSSSAIECTSSKAAPIVDTVIMAYQIVRTGVAFAADESDYDGAPISRGVDMGFGVALTALFGGSAIYGYTVTGKCKDAKAGRGGEY